MEQQRREESGVVCRPALLTGNDPSTFGDYSQRILKTETGKN